MTASNLTLSANINFDLLGDTITTPIVVETPYTSSSVGQIDIPEATAEATSFQIPTGSIGSITGLYVKNTNESAIGIVWNSAEGIEYELTVGGAILIAMPTVPDDDPIAAITIVTTALQVADGNVQYALFGT